MCKKKENHYYLINICENGKVTTIRCETFKEKELWLIHYFATEEQWWAWEKYTQWAGGSITFEKFVTTLAKKGAGLNSQIFNIRKGKSLIIQRKEK